MNKKRTTGFTSALLVALGIAFFWTSASWGHGEETRIVPASLTVKAGSELKVTVNGLAGTKTATFRLTGISGMYELGRFQVGGDDFTQVLLIPARVPPGSYRLSVEGGERRAKVVITVN